MLRTHSNNIATRPRAIGSTSFQGRTENSARAVVGAVAKVNANGKVCGKESHPGTTPLLPLRMPTSRTVLARSVGRALKKPWSTTGAFVGHIQKRLVLSVMTVETLYRGRPVSGGERGVCMSARCYRTKLS